MNPCLFVSVSRLALFICISGSIILAQFKNGEISSIATGNLGEGTGFWDPLIMLNGMTHKENEEINCLISR